MKRVEAYRNQFIKTTELVTFNYILFYYWRFMYTLIIKNLYTHFIYSTMNVIGPFTICSTF